MVWIAFLISLQGHTQNGDILVSIAGNCWWFNSSYFMQFLNKYKFKNTMWSIIVHKQYTEECKIGPKPFLSTLQKIILKNRKCLTNFNITLKVH